MKKRLFLFYASVNKISETAAIYWTGRLMLNCLSNDTIRKPTLKTLYKAMIDIVKDVYLVLQEFLYHM